MQDAVALGVLVAQARLIKYAGAVHGVSMAAHATAVPVALSTTALQGHKLPGIRWTPAALGSRPRTISAAGAAAAAMILLRGLDPALALHPDPDRVHLRSSYRRR